MLGTVSDTLNSLKNNNYVRLKHHISIFNNLLEYIISSHYHISFTDIINDIIGYIDIYVYPTRRLIQTQWINSSDIAGEISLLMDSHQRGVIFSIVLREGFVAGNFYFSEILLKIKSIVSYCLTRL